MYQDENKPVSVFSDKLTIFLNILSLLTAIALVYIGARVFFSLIEILKETAEVMTNG